MGRSTQIMAMTIKIPPLRELKNRIDRVLISTEDNTIVESDLQRILFPAARHSLSANERCCLKDELEKLELKYMEEAYASHQSIRRSAQMLGMTPSTFQRRRAELQRKYGSLPSAMGR